MVPPERADEWARRLVHLRKTIQEIVDYRHEDVASFFPEWLREEDDRYANVRSSCSTTRCARSTVSMATGACLKA